MSVIDETLVAPFMALFSGRRDAYGYGDAEGGGVAHSQLDAIKYAAHLRGDAGVGVFPMRDDNTVLFGAIDLDEPNFALARSMQKLLPGDSWIESSRSGNAHVWVFFDEAAPAWAVRTILRFATEAVGRPDVEIFPKQDRLREGGVGNYINLPYCGDERPILRPDDGPPEFWEAHSLQSFLYQAERGRCSAASWERRARALGGQPPEERAETSEWGEQAVLHECAAYIIERAVTGEQPIAPGSRHQVIFHVAKQLLNWRELDQQGAWRELQSFNANGVKPPVSAHELKRIFGNAVEGRFTSTGCDDPLMAPYVHPDCPIAHG